MQHVSSVTTVTAAARKAAALLAYDTACASPGAADWRTVADLLRAAVSSPARSESSAPRWFADWKLGRVYTLDTLLVGFDDGEVVRCNIAKAPGKLPRIAAACRVAIGFYRARTRRHDVPAFAYIQDTATGASFDAEACSSLTADIRRADHADAAPQARASVERLEWLASEVERRRAGLARAIDREVRETNNGRRPTFRDGSNAWRAALNGGRKELAAMRRALAGTPTLISAATIEVEEINVRAAEVPAATGSEIPADLTIELSGNLGQLPAPLDTHPIVAVCTSHRGREKLLALVQDGCFPDHGRREYHGAYRVTLQDAQEIGAIRGVRFVGLPRKPRTRPVVAVPASAPIIVPAFACRSLAHLTRGAVTLHAANVL